MEWSFAAMEGMPPLGMGDAVKLSHQEAIDLQERIAQKTRPDDVKDGLR